MSRVKAYFQLPILKYNANLKRQMIRIKRSAKWLDCKDFSNITPKLEFRFLKTPGAICRLIENDIYTMRNYHSP